jgi:hypothetical protein
MTYALRAWADDELRETLDSPDASVVLARFRAMVAKMPKTWPGMRWFITVNCEPGPYPERSFPIALYQHVPERTN